MLRTSEPPNQPLQPTHSAVARLASATRAPAGGRLNGGVRRHKLGWPLISMALAMVVTEFACAKQSNVVTGPRPRPSVPLATLPTTAATPTVGPVFHISGKVKPPEVVSRVEPRWPEGPPGHWVQGLWILEAVIDESGQVRDVKVVREPVMKPPWPEKTREICSDLAAWRYKPATLDGKPIAVYLTVTVLPHFRDP